MMHKVEEVTEGSSYFDSCIFNSTETESSNFLREILFSTYFIFLCTTQSGHRDRVTSNHVTKLDYKLLKKEGSFQKQPALLTLSHFMEHSLLTLLVISQNLFHLLFLHSACDLYEENVILCT